MTPRFLVAFPPRNHIIQIFPSRPKPREEVRKLAARIKALSGYCKINFTDKFHRLKKMAKYSLKIIGLFVPELVV